MAHQNADDATALYRLYDASDVLLYVGISVTPEARWKAHLYGPDRFPWARTVARRTVEWHPDRADALRAERQVVLAERPMHNGTHNYSNVAFDPDRWPRISNGDRKTPIVAALIREEITTGRWSPGQRLPPLKVMASAAAVSTSIVSKASGELQREGLLTFESGRGLFVSVASKPL
ncbi:GntR family transcriptional regulator [Streptomyces venezuelae]|uniref:GntR family transcriptional regulator n=1 Tax=Streptomyces venezuelae TaxID=54571 RepID=UPI0034565685